MPLVDSSSVAGLNRGNNNRTNTFEAALEAKSRALDYLDLIELGNEPDREFHKPWFYSKSPSLT